MKQDRLTLYKLDGSLEVFLSKIYENEICSGVGYNGIWICSDGDVSSWFSPSQYKRISLETINA